MALLTEPNLSGRGKREDLADTIALVDAKETPVASMAKKGSKPGNMYFRWQADALPAPIVGGVVDGTDISSYNNYVSGVRTELANYAQLYRDAVRVSSLTQDVAVVAGVRDELANNVAKSIIAIKRGIEATICSNQTAQADDGSVAYRTGGLQKWIAASDASNSAAVNITSGSTIQVPAAFTSRYDAILTGANASTSLTDSAVQTMMKTIYNQTGKYQSYDAIVGVDLKRAFTGLLSTTTLTTTSTGGVTGAGATKVQTFQRDANAEAFIQSVDVFQGDFGTIRLHPSTFIGTISGSTWTATSFKGLLLDMSQIELRYGGNVAEVTTLPDNGGGPARMVQAVCGLVVGNPLALGKFDYSAA
jgi:hypothetical protein